MIHLNINNYSDKKGYVLQLTLKQHSKEKNRTNKKTHNLFFADTPKCLLHKVVCYIYNYIHEIPSYSLNHDVYTYDVAYLKGNTSIPVENLSPELAEMIGKPEFTYAKRFLLDTLDKLSINPKLLASTQVLITRFTYESECKSMDISFY